MQEEVENRTVNLAITTTKLSFRSLYAAYMKYRRYRSDKKAIKTAKKAQQEKAKSEIHGKQTVKELVGQNQGVSNMEIAKSDLKGFEKVTQKYGVDYEMIVGEGMFHCYPVFPIVKEAKDGWELMVRLMKNG